MSEPKRTGFLELLRATQGSQFVIPVYQRNYTWKANEQVNQYLLDLENVLKGNYKNHFLGIIIYLEKSLDFSTRELSVIDGQQRLTTTFLIIYAIKKMFENKGEVDRVNQLEGQFLTNPYATDKVKYKLKPLVSDDDVYRCIVENRFDEIIDQDSNIYKNYEYIYDKLQEWIDCGFDLNSILMALDKLYIVCVPISEEDNAQKIFESINATGAKLTAADLIRNFLLMDIQSDLQDIYYRDYWKKLEDYVSKDSKELEMFFRMVLAIKTYRLVSKNSVYREFMDWVECNDYKHNIANLFEELLDYAKTYDFIYKNQNNGELQKLLVDFIKLKADLPLPLFIEFGRLYRHKRIDTETFSNIILSVNSYLIRRSICDLNSQNISRLFPSILKKVLEKCDGDYTDVVEYLNQEMVGNTLSTSGSYMPTDKQMIDLLYNASVYGRPSLKIVLERMELDNNYAPIDLSNLSVEHLMPQTPTKEWLENLNTDIETYQNNIHRLGNLTLATKRDNSKMSNSNWNYKNEVLKDTSHIKMNMKLLEKEDWTLEDIDNRTKSMIEEICKLYPYPKIDLYETNTDLISEEDAVRNALNNSKYVNLVRINKRLCKDINTNAEYYLFVAKLRAYSNKDCYWFSVDINKIEEDNNSKFIFICRSNTISILEIPQSIIAKYKNNFNNSKDVDGNIYRFHVTIYEYDNKYTLLLSKPTNREIDISEYIIK